MTAHRLRTESASYLRNFIFGVEDSLVSTVGLLSGIAIANVDRKTIILTGIVLIFVEAFSMAAGSFLSESSAQGYLRRKDDSSRIPLSDGAIMFVAYFIAGFIPLASYFVLPVTNAFPASVSLSLLALFGLGVWGGSMSRMSVVKSGLRMFVIGGIAIAVGIAAGYFVA